MLSKIEALNYRCLRYIRQPVKGFHVLVGPNASGKTTFLDVVGFLSQFVGDGLDAALTSRTANFFDLVWRHESDGFQLALEALVPDDAREKLEEERYDTVRYEVSIEFNKDSQEVVIAAEQGFLTTSESRVDDGEPPLLFPDSLPAPDSLFRVQSKRSKLRLFSKTRGGNDNYYAEAHRKAGRWRPAFKLGPRKSTLGNLPEDEENFPVSSWFKQFLTDGVEKIILNSAHMRKASPPGKGVRFMPDGSNLPWVIAHLEKTAPDRVKEWVCHLQTALGDLEAIRTVEREDDKHRYLVLVYRGGLEVPSWMASDGTLRLLALTLPAYLDELGGIYLIEEPENGIHPRAVETMYQSLSSVYGAQILLATHSPVILSTVDAKDVLCFAKDADGATAIVRGDKHPRLKSWHGQVNFGTLFAAGVLG